MKKKIIFLDFDGVLHPLGSSLNNFFSASKNFFDLIKDANVSIVISSSWQFDSNYSQIKSKLPEPIRKKILGETGIKYEGTKSRIREIQYFLIQNNLQNIDWIALDDQPDKFGDDFNKLILCNPKTGITRMEIIKILKWLKKKE